MRHSLLVPLVCVAAFALGGGPARAAHAPQVVVLEPRTQGEISSGDRARVGDALWAALDRLGMRRVADADRDAVLSGEVGLRACLDQSECLERLGRLLEAAYTISVLVVRTAPTAYRAQVRLFDVDVGETGAEIDWSCTACSAEDVARRIDSLVESAVQKDHEKPRATLLIRSTPPNADVQIDGRKVGFTELERRVFAGPHDIVVSLSRMNLAPERLRVDLAGEQRVVLSVSLTEKVAAPAPPERTGPAVSMISRTADAPKAGRSRWQLGLGIPLLLIGAGGAALGTASLVLDGQCVDMPACERSFDGKLAGSIEIGVGGALALVGAILIGVDVARENRSRRPRVTLLPTAGSGGAGLGLVARY